MQSVIRGEEKHKPCGQLPPTSTNEARAIGGIHPQQLLHSQMHLLMERLQKTTQSFVQQRLKRCCGTTALLIPSVFSKQTRACFAHERSATARTRYCGVGSIHSRLSTCLDCIVVLARHLCSIICHHVSRFNLHTLIAHELR